MPAVIDPLGIGSKSRVSKVTGFVQFELVLSLSMNRRLLLGSWKKTRMVKLSLPLTPVTANLEFILIDVGVATVTGLSLVVVVSLLAVVPLFVVVPLFADVAAVVSLFSWPALLTSTPTTTAPMTMESIATPPRIHQILLLPVDFQLRGGCTEEASFIGFISTLPVPSLPSRSPVGLVQYDKESPG
jgi:hypothetical protein